MIVLTPIREFKVPVFAECISPDVFEGKNLAQIGQLLIYEGNREKKLQELFKVEETETAEGIAEPAITIQGDVSRVKYIGARMTKGEIIINGSVGMHLGEEMKGGKISVHGNAGGWAGSAMKGGVIEIHGDAGDYLATPYRGSTQGMSGGKIIVHGNAGVDAGAYMRKGIIKVYGNAGQFAGMGMHDGMIYVKGNCDGRAGSCMTGGTIVISGFIESILPSFTFDGLKKKVKIEESEVVDMPFYLFIGDLTENGKGKLYVSKTNNPQLSHYERFL